MKGVNTYKCDDILFRVSDPASVLSVLPVTSDLLMTATREFIDI